MSNRTIVEFNHDQWGAIRDRPEEFVEAVLLMLRCGANEARDSMSRFGVQCGPTVHHTNQRRVDFGSFVHEFG